MLKLLLFVLPLGLDTFAVAAALGVQGLPRRQRLKVSLLMSSFEMTMPIVGLLLGRGVGSAIGGVGDYIAAGALVALGIYVLLEDEEDESAKLASGGGSWLTTLALGVSISLDELAMGFTIGLLGLSLPLAIVLIGLQAFLLAQLGLRLGSRVGEAGREWSERLAGVALLGIAVLIVAEKIAA